MNAKPDDRADAASISIEAIDANAMRILQDDFNTLARELERREPGTKLTWVGSPGVGARDAALVITAAAGLIVAATPTISLIIVAFLSARGIKVELEVEAGTGRIKLKCSKM